MVKYRDYRDFKKGFFFFFKLQASTAKESPCVQIYGKYLMGSCRGEALEEEMRSPEGFGGKRSGQKHSVTLGEKGDPPSR